MYHYLCLCHNLLRTTQELAWIHVASQEQEYLKQKK